jgi:hypothetical protein
MNGRRVRAFRDRKPIPEHRHLPVLSFGRNVKVVISRFSLGSERLGHPPFVGCCVRHQQGSIDNVGSATN